MLLNQIGMFGSLGFQQNATLLTRQEMRYLSLWPFFLLIDHRAELHRTFPLEYYPLGNKILKAVK